MHFLIIIKLCFHLLLCQVVGSSRHLFLQNETIVNDDFEIIPQKFFVDLNDAYLEKIECRDVTFLGASTYELQQARPLLERYPCIICKDTEICAYSQRVSEGSLVLVFLEDFSEETFGKNMKILSRCRSCKVLFLSNRIVRVNDIRLIFTLAIRHNISYSDLVHFGKNRIELYGDFFLTNCTMEVRLIAVWRPGAGLDKIRTWVFRSRDMNGCPVSVSSLTFTPKMFTKVEKNGSVSVVGGQEGALLLILASKLNFTINLRYPSVEKRMKVSRKMAIIDDVVSGISEIGIGRLRPTHTDMIKISFPYNDECITWGVPRIMIWSDNIVLVEFSWPVWALVGLVFVIACIFIYANTNIVVSKNSERKSLGLVTIVLDAVALHLGNPIIYGFSSVGGRFILIVYLFYTLVIITAYKTSLAAILTTEEGTPIIADAQGIIDANLNVAGSLYDYDILKDQVTDSELTLKLLQRFQVDNDDYTIWEHLLLGQDWAILGRRSYLSYNRQMIINDHDFVDYNILNGCVLSYPTVMVFGANTFLHKPIDIIIRNLVESGILQHWDIIDYDTEKLLQRKNIEKYFESHAVYKFYNIFLFYSICIFVSTVTFFIELLSVKFDLRKRNHAPNQVYDN